MNMKATAEKRFDVTFMGICISKDENLQEGVIEILDVKGSLVHRIRGIEIGQINIGVK